MAEIIQCPLCQRQLQIDAGAYGQWFKCPSCGGTFQITAGAGAKAQAPAPAAAPRSRSASPAPPPRVWQDPPPPPPRPQPAVREELDLQKQLSQAPPTPHRGYLVLALGFIALALFAVSPVGWILGGMAMMMGADDLQRMQRGTMDRHGETMTLIGRISGVIAVILSTVVVFAYLVIFFHGI